MGPGLGWRIQVLGFKAQRQRLSLGFEIAVLRFRMLVLEFCNLGGCCMDPGMAV